MLISLKGCEWVPQNLYIVVGSIPHQEPTKATKQRQRNRNHPQTLSSIVYTYNTIQYIFLPQGRKFRRLFMVKTRPSSSALVRPSNLSFCQLQDIWTSMNTRRKCQVPNPTPPPPLFHVKQNLEAMCTYTSFRVFNLNSITFSATFVDSLRKSRASSIDISNNRTEYNIVIYSGRRLVQDFATHASLLGTDG